MKKIYAQILILAEDVAVYNSARSLLKQQFSSVAICDSPEDLHDILTSQVFDIVLLDLDYLQGGGKTAADLYWLGYILRTDPHTRVIMLMDPNQAELTVECLKAGATDFILKPWSMAKLSATVTKALSLKPGKRGNRASQREQSDEREETPGAGQDSATDKGADEAPRQQRKEESEDPFSKGDDPGALPPAEYENWSAEASRALLTSFNEGIINRIPNARELEEMEVIVIRKSLEKHKGNFKEVAADLGMPEGDLYFKLEKYNL